MPSFIRVFFSLLAYRGLYTASRVRLVMLTTVLFTTVGVGSAAALSHRSAIPAPPAPLASGPLPPDSTVFVVAAPPPHRHVPRAARPPAAASSTPVAVRASRPRPKADPAAYLPTGPTRWPLLNAAIARIPSYPPGRSIWLVSTRFPQWGTADWYHDTLYISPRVPPAYLYDVAVHEWSHELSVLDYSGDVNTAVAAMNDAFGAVGQDGLVGAERAADCMAILQGATWTHYTTCDNSQWRHLAARLLAGQRL